MIISHKKSIFLGLLALSSLWFGHKLEATDPRPNIIFIMADDLGYSDIGCYGGEAKTRSLFWEHQGNKALRHGHWKLVKEHGFFILKNVQPGQHVLTTQ